MPNDQRYDMSDRFEVLEDYTINGRSYILDRMTGRVMTCAKAVHYARKMLELAKAQLAKEQS